MLLVQSHFIEFIGGKHYLWYERNILYAEGFDGNHSRASPVVLEQWSANNAPFIKGCMLSLAAFVQTV